MLRSALGMTHVLQSRLVMDYTTSYFPLIVLGYHYTQKLTRSTLALELSGSPPYYPWVTATTTFCFKAASRHTSRHFHTAPETGSCRAGFQDISTGNPCGDTESRSCAAVFQETFQVIGSINPGLSP